MPLRRVPLIIALFAALLLAACGVNPGSAATPTPTSDPTATPAASPTPTPAPTATPTSTPTPMPQTTPTPTPDSELEARCFSTKAYATEHIFAVIGEDKVPTAFDAINGGGCEFNLPITVVHITLTKGSHTQTAVITLPEPTTELGVAFPDSLDVPVIDGSLAPGRYTRIVTAFTEDGQSVAIEGFEPVVLVEDEDSVQTKLLHAQSRWDRAGIETYTYETAWQCFCLVEYNAKVDVVVTNGDVTSVTFVDPEMTGDVPEPERFRTIDGLFEFLQDAIDQNAHEIRVTFDEERGYPTEAWVDYQEMMADEEMGFVVSNVQLQ